MPKTVYTPAPEVKEIADDLISKYHQHLIDFSVRLEYNFVNKVPKKNGAEVWGTCRKVTGQNAFLANHQEGSDPFFVITISEPVWEVLDHDKRIALVDHELCHAFAVENQKAEDNPEAEPVKYSIKPHDLEEFSCIVKRYGLWSEDVEAFVKAATAKAERVEESEEA